MNYKFIQPVSMRVTQEQYERDLRKPLLAMGYEEAYYLSWMDNSYDYLVTNFNEENNKIYSLTMSSAHRHNRYFIDHYNPKLFLAIAAMTNKECGICGEWWYCTKDVKMLSDGRIEYNKGKLYMGLDNERIINNSRKYNHYWRDDYRFEHFRKATLQELINKFTNQKQDIMKKELTQEQFEGLENLIAPENKEKFNKLFKVNKNAIKKDLEDIDFGTDDISIARCVFSCDDNYKQFEYNYIGRSIWVTSNIEIHIVDGDEGDKLIMFNEK